MVKKGGKSGFGGENPLDLKGLGPWRGNFGVPVLGNGEKWWKKPQKKQNNG